MHCPVTPRRCPSGSSRLSPLFPALALGAAILSLPRPAPAQEPTPADTEAVTELSPLIVTANPLGRPADDLVQPVEVLSGSALERRRRGSLGESLENELGVSSSDFGPGVGRPVIRGQGGPRVQVLENGIAAMDASTVSSDHAVSIDPAHAEQIEIIKGPATLIYGSGASAGVINVANRRLPEQFRAGWENEMEFSFADNANERQARADLNYGAAGFQFHLDGASRDSEDFAIPGTAGRDGSGSRGTLANSAVSTRSGAVSAARIADEGVLAAALSVYNSRYGLPTEETAFVDLEQTRYDLLARRLAPVAGLESLKLRLGYNDYTHTEFEDPVTPGTVFVNRELETRLEAVHRPLAGFRGVIGLQLGDRDFSAVGDEAFVQPARTRSSGLYWVEERPQSFGRLEIGARIERVENVPAATRPSDGAPNTNPRTGARQPATTHTPASFSLGQLIDLGERHHLRLGYTHAERAPSAEELYAFGPHLATATFERGDARFGEERSDNFEIGLERHGERWDWSLSAYYNRLGDYLYPSENDCNRDAGDFTGACSPDGSADQVLPDGRFVAPADVAGLTPEEQDELLRLVDYRQDAARFWGVEAQTRYRLFDGPSRLWVRLFGDWVRGTLEDGGNLPRVTPARVGLGLDGRWNALAWGLDWTRTLDQNRISPLETASEGYDLLGLDLSRTWTAEDDSSATLYLRGRNLLDEEARRHASFLKDAAPLAGRTWVAGLILRY